MDFDQVNSNLTFLEHLGRIRGQIGRVLDRFVGLDRIQ
jgi:hypothetical protein